MLNNNTLVLHIIKWVVSWLQKLWRYLVRGRKPSATATNQSKTSKKASYADATTTAFHASNHDEAMSQPSPKQAQPEKQPLPPELQKEAQNIAKTALKEEEKRTELALKQQEQIKQKEALSNKETPEKQQKDLRSVVQSVKDPVKTPVRRGGGGRRPAARPQAVDALVNEQIELEQKKFAERVLKEKTSTGIAR